MSSKKFENKWGIGTKLVHSAEEPDPQTGAIAPILVRTKTFRQPEFGKESKWQYSRGKNPTRTILENKLSKLAGGGSATVFASGDAATANFLLTLDPGDEIVCCNELYGGTVRLFDQLFSKFGIKAVYVDINNSEEVKQALTPKSKILWVESPTNPKLGIIDLKQAGKLAKKYKLHYVADMTFSPPCTTSPFDYGVETIVYSLSKYFGGHNDALGGAIVTKNKKLHEDLCWLQWSVGALLSPDECYRFIQEVKTLGLRWERASRTAMDVAAFLQKQPKISKVYYPGFASHPDYSIAKKQMKNGFGSVIGIDLKTSKNPEIKRFVQDLKQTGIIMFAESLASPETILAHPASMSHRGMSDEQRQELAITNNFLRLSVGLEDPKDIKSALEHALAEI